MQIERGATGTKCQMSGMHFQTPCGLEIIIAVIIQHLNNAFSCAEHWDAHLPRDLMLVFVCRHKHECVSQRYRASRARRGKVMERECDVCISTEMHSRKSLLHLAPNSPFLSLSVLSLAPLSSKEIGLEVEQISVIFISQLGEGWLRRGAFPLFMVSSPLFFCCFPTTICASFLCTLYILRPALWFNMHDKFYSCVPTHYPLD